MVAPARVSEQQRGSSIANEVISKSGLGRDDIVGKFVEDAPASLFQQRAEQQEAARSMGTQPGGPVETAVSPFTQAQQEAHPIQKQEERRGATIMASGQRTAYSAPQVAEQPLAPTTQQQASKQQPVVPTGQVDSTPSVTDTTGAGAFVDDLSRLSAATAPIANANRSRVQSAGIEHVSMEDTIKMVGAHREDMARGSEQVSLGKDNDDNVKQIQAPVPKTAPKTVDAPTSQFYDEQRAVKSETTQSVAAKNWSGGGFTEKAIANRDVNPGDVSIGTQIVAELIREPRNMLIDIVNRATGKNYTAEQLLDTNTLFEFCDDINSHEIYVIGSKSPVPGPSSAQERRLRVHYGRGVLIHPTQTKIYNLDFDGDGVTIQFSLDKGLFRNAMDYLINEMNEGVIDFDFFPLPKINGTREEFKALLKQRFFEKIDSSINTDRLIGLYYDVIHPELADVSQLPEAYRGDKKKIRNYYLAEFAREMNVIASRYSNRHAVLSYLLKDMFDQMLVLQNAEIEIQSITNPDRMSDLIEPEQVDQYVAMVIDDVAAGNLPPNFQDFLIGMNRYIGEIEGKNVTFRLGADIAKRIKFSGVLVKGNEGARDLYEKTLEAGLAAFMSSRAHIGEKVSRVKEIIQEQIRRDAGFPSDYQTLQEWVERFVPVYNKWISLISLSNMEFGCDLDPVYNGKTKNRRVENGRKSGNQTIYPLVVDKKSREDGNGLIDAVLFAYGDYTISRMFPNISYGTVMYKPPRVDKKTGKVIHEKNKSFHRGTTYDGLPALLTRYRDYTLTKLSCDNHIAASYRKVSDVTSATATEMDFVCAIADKRSKKASKFNDDLDTLLANMTRAISTFQLRYDKRHENMAGFLAYVENMMSLFHASGPDMFSYFGMNNASAWLNSHYGQLFLAAVQGSKAADAVGGIRISMVIEYRLRVIASIEADIKSLVDAANPESMDMVDYPRINALQNRVVDELGVLGSSSDLWSVLAQEISGNTFYFDQLKSGQAAKVKSGLLADGYWKASQKHSSLLEVLRDPDLTKTEKEKIATDVVRLATGFADLQPHEISYQLEIGPHSNYTSLSTMAYKDQPDILSDIQKVNNRFERFFTQSWGKIREDVEEVAEFVKANPGALDTYLARLWGNPQAYLEIQDDLIVDAIDAQMDKSSAAAEKAHQEGPVRVLYAALMKMKGGYTNAVYRAEERTLGMIAEKNLTPYDTLYVLAHPEVSLTVYNGRTRYTYSRATLCGDNSEQALIEMLRKNPMIAAYLRPGVASVGKADVYRNARMSLMDAVACRPQLNSEILDGRVKSTLIDKPMFLAMVAMFRPQAGKTSESIRQATRESLSAMQKCVTVLAAHSIKRNVGTVEDYNTMAEQALGRLGVSVETLISKGGMDRTAAESWFIEMKRHLSYYISDIAGYLKEDKALLDAARSVSFTADDISFDASSAALAVDVRQTMTGAKTEISTEIEGGMTQENLGVALWSMHETSVDRYMIIDGNMSENELWAFAGCNTNAGMLMAGDGNIRDAVIALEDSLPDNVPLIVEIPEDMVRQDPTLDPSGDYQINSVSRFLITKRTKASEEYNLKAKKSGDDGLDSITKTTRYAPGAQANIDIITDIYEREGRFAAILKLAQLLQAADADEGYTDISLADYMNIANLLLLDVVDDGAHTVIIRSLGEISTAIRTNMDPDVVANGTPKEKIDNAVRIVEEVGFGPIGDDYIATPEYGVNAALYAANRIASSPDLGTSFRPVKSRKMSSKERLFEEAMKIAQSLKDPDPIKSPIRIANKRRELKKFVPFDSGNYNIIGVCGRYANGEPFGPMLRSVGPTSAWLIDKTATNEDVEKILPIAEQYGMTLIFDIKDADLFPSLSRYLDDIVEAPFGTPYTYMIPFFSMRVNNAASLSTSPMAPASFQFDPSWIWYAIEDSHNMYGLADGESLISGITAAQTQCLAGKTESFNLDNLFANTRAAFKDSVGPVEFCTREEIQRRIVSWLDGGPTIDIGIAPENSLIDDRMKKLGLQLEEYRRDFSTADDYGFLSSGKPDRIIGWVKCSVIDDGVKKEVYAPIIPWQTGASLSAPTRFDLTGNYELNRDQDTFNFGWRISEDIDGQYCKVHDGMGAAGKSMVMFLRSRYLGRLRNGRNIDMVTAAESFASRRLAWGKRMCTLKTLALTMGMPPYGYNWAEVDGSFPGLDENMRQRMLTERLSIEEWHKLYDSGIRFAQDPKINTMLDRMVKKALDTGTTNPSDILATKFGGKFSFMYIDYDFFFDTSIDFQNTLMAWYNMMQPDVCPPDIYSFDSRTDGKGYLFKPLLGSSEYETGCMQMAVPHEGQTGTFWRYENVYASFSFYNDDFSGLHKVGLNGASRTMEQLNAMALSGKPLEGRNMQLYTQNAAALTSRPARPYDRELDYGKFIRKER